MILVGTTVSGASEFVVAPYLLDVTDHSATVAFHLDEALPAVVHIHDREQVRAFVSAGASESHFVPVTGLEPSRAYRYSVVCGDGAVQTTAEDPGYVIRTAGRAGESFTFAVYGDARPGDTGTDRYHRAVVDRVIEVDPAFCLILGDMVDSGADRDQWRAFLDIEAPMLRRAAAFTVFGDNDFAGGRGLGAQFFPALEKGYYHFVWNGVHFFAARTYDTRGAQPRDELDADSPQFRWLDAELATPEVQAAPFRVVFMHDPVYISRGRSAEVLGRTWAPMLRTRRVDVVFASWHLYERLHVDGVIYVTTGGAGAELLWQEPNPAFPAQADARRHHFCRVDVTDGAMTIRAIADDGTILDSITIAPKPLGQDDAGRLARASRRLRREIRLDAGQEAPALRLFLFSYDCAFCKRLLNVLLPRWARDAGVTLDVSYYDLAIEGVYELLMAAGADFGRQSADIPTVFVGDAVIGGEREIAETLPAQLAAFRRDPQAYAQRAVQPFEQSHDTTALRERAFTSLALGLVIGAGLLDGINPCAFTTVIFLLSYLSLAGGTRRQLVRTGGLFTLAVFLTYLGIGLAFSRVAAIITANRVVATAVHAALLALVTVLAGLSAVDFVRCLRGRAASITLQLPGFLKKSIRGRIRNFARGGATAGIAAFVLGAVIAGAELACTGQVYIPIVTMLSEPRYRAEAAFYLLAYNFAFVLPLVVVFLLAAFGVSSKRMGDVLARHVALVKLAMTALFAAMAGVLVFNLL